MTPRKSGRRAGARGRQAEFNLINLELEALEDGVAHLARRRRRARVCAETRDVRSPKAVGEGLRHRGVDSIGALGQIEAVPETKEKEDVRGSESDTVSRCDSFACNTMSCSNGKVHRVLKVKSNQLT